MVKGHPRMVLGYLGIQGLEAISVKGYPRMVLGYLGILMVKGYPG